MFIGQSSSGRGWRGSHEVARDGPRREVVVAVSAIERGGTPEAILSPGSPGSRTVAGYVVAGLAIVALAPFAIAIVAWVIDRGWSLTHMGCARHARKWRGYAAECA